MSAQRTGSRASPNTELGDVLARLVDEIVNVTPFERVIVAAGFHRALLGVGRGFPDDEVDAFARKFARWRAGVETESPVGTLGSVRSPVLVPAPSPSSDFSAVAVVEAATEHPGVTRISEVLRAAMPSVVAAAEAYALEARRADRESTRRYAWSALDALPDPVVVTDAESRILLTNRRGRELFVGDLIDPSARRRAVETNERFLRALQAKGDHVREIVLLDPEDGSNLVFEVSSMPADDPDSGTEGRVLVLRDVTDLKAASRELEVQLSRSVAAQQRARLEWERLDVIVQNAAVPIFVTDGHARIHLVNREAARLLEPRPGTAPSSPRIRDLESNHAKLTGFISELLLHARARREGRLVLVDPDEARELPVLAVSTKVLDERGEATAVVTVLLDPTHGVETLQLGRPTGELTMRNTPLDEQHTAFERAARLKNEFLATMSHELRTPINALLGYNSLLRDGLFGALTERQRDALDRMRNAAEHLLSMINDLLDLSRVEAGKIGLSPVDIEWSTFLETVSEPIRPLAERKSLSLSVEIEPGLPKIRTDDMRLRQVLLNLLTNAVKFTDRGSLGLRVGSPAGSNRIQIDVTDTGIGIDETHLEAIFDEFTQVDQSSTREHGGAGLGLAISRRLIRAMGGSLTVKSAPGRGSTFRVELPAVPPSSRTLVLGPQTARERSAS